MMFSVFCPTHNSRVLMTRRNAISFWNTDDGHGHHDGDHAKHFFDVNLREFGTLAFRRCYLEFIISP